MALRLMISKTGATNWSTLPHNIESLIEAVRTFAIVGWLGVFIGLGLFLSKAIVEAHGGTIDIGPNADGPGTTLTFTFPPSAVVDGRHHDASLSTGR